MGAIYTGMSQKISILFTAQEYKVVSDVLEIESEFETLLVPIYSFPFQNSITIPKSLEFGNIPICSTVTKILTLKSTVPVGFHYNIEFLKPHPYFNFEPLEGYVEANTIGTINVSFRAITLSTCLASIHIHIQSGIENDTNIPPIICMLSAKSVSGLVEANAIKQQEMKLTSLLQEKQMSLQLLNTTTTSHNKIYNGSMNTSSSTKIQAIGVGSGAVLDAGAEWIRTKQLQTGKLLYLLLLHVISSATILQYLLNKYSNCISIIIIIICM
jgi:hypothetical protein